MKIRQETLFRHTAKLFAALSLLNTAGIVRDFVRVSSLEARLGRTQDALEYLAENRQLNSLYKEMEVESVAVIGLMGLTAASRQLALRSRSPATGSRPSDLEFTLERKHILNGLDTNSTPFANDIGYVTIPRKPVYGLDAIPAPLMSNGSAKLPHSFTHNITSKVPEGE